VVTLQDRDPARLVFGLRDANRCARSFRIHIPELYENLGVLGMLQTRKASASLSLAQLNCLRGRGRLKTTSTSTAFRSASRGPGRDNLELRHAQRHEAQFSIGIRHQQQH
jgi:hypothetical protein